VSTGKECLVCFKLRENVLSISIDLSGGERKIGIRQKKYEGTVDTHPGGEMGAEKSRPSKGKKKTDNKGLNLETLVLQRWAAKLEEGTFSRRKVGPEWVRGGGLTWSLAEQKKKVKGVKWKRTKSLTPWGHLGPGRPKDSERWTKKRKRRNAF